MSRKDKVGAAFRHFQQTKDGRPQGRSKLQNANSKFLATYAKIQRRMKRKNKNGEDDESYDSSDDDDCSSDDEE